jgi:hypothetical protein
VKRRGGNALVNCPINSTPKYILTVVIHAKNKAAVDHDAKGVQAASNCLVVAAEVLPLVTTPQVFWRKRFEAYKDAAQTSFRGTLYEVTSQNGVHCGCALEHTSHALHAFKKRFGKVSVPEQVIVEEIEMASG